MKSMAKLARESRSHALCPKPLKLQLVLNLVFLLAETGSRTGSELPQSLVTNTKIGPQLIVSLCFSVSLLAHTWNQKMGPAPKEFTICVCTAPSVVGSWVMTGLLDVTTNANNNPHFSNSTLFSSKKIYEILDKRKGPVLYLQCLSFTSVTSAGLGPNFGSF